MKKSFFVLVLAALAVFSAFAQEGTPTLIWGARVSSGIDIATKKNADDGYETKVELRTYDNPVPHGVTPYDLGLSGMLFGDTYGFMLNLQSNYDGTNNKNALNLDHPSNHAYGWAYFLNKKVRADAGLIYFSPWHTGFQADTQFGWHFTSFPGLRLQVLPIDGLSIGADFEMVHQGPWYAATDVNPADIGDFFKNTTYGVSYDVEKFYVGGQFKLINGSDTSVVDLSVPAFQAGIVLKNVAGLVSGLNVGTEIFFQKGIQQEENSPAVNHFKDNHINVRAAYKVNDSFTNVSITAKVYLLADNKVDIDIDAISAEYRFNDTYKLNFDVILGNLLDNYQYYMGPEPSKDGFTLKLKPMLTYTKGRAKIIVFDELKVAPVVENTFHIGFAWSVNIPGL